MGGPGPGLQLDCHVRNGRKAGLVGRSFPLRWYRIPPHLHGTGRAIWSIQRMGLRNAVPDWNRGMADACIRRLQIHTATGGWLIQTKDSNLSRKTGPYGPVFFLHWIRISSVVKTKTLDPQQRGIGSAFHDMRKATSAPVCGATTSPETVLETTHGFSMTRLHF